MYRPSFSTSSPRSRDPRWPQVDRRTSDTVTAALYSRRWAIASPSSPFASRLDEVESQLARLLGRRDCALTCNGSAAIVIALQALGIGPEKRVLLPATTWVGCATAVLRAGAVPVFADTSENSPVMDLEAIPDETFDAIDALLAVHPYASHLDLATLRRRLPNLPIVEDCAHCPTSRDSAGRLLGTFGTIAVYSFQATKILTCGEGGAALTDDPEIAEQLKALRADSRRRREVPVGSRDLPLEAARCVHGANYALSEISAAVLDDQIGRLEGQCAVRAEGVDYFAGALAERFGADAAVVGDAACLASGAFYGVVVRLPDLAPVGDGEHENALVDRLIDDVECLSGIRCGRLYPPVPLSPLYRPETISRYPEVDHNKPLPNAKRWYRSALVVPHPFFLAPPSHADRLIDALSRALAPRRGRRVRPSRVEPAEAPEIAVVVVSRRRGSLLAEALQTVAAQDYQGPVRVVLLGDCNDRLRDLVDRHTRERLHLTAVNLEAGDWLRDLPTVARIARLRNLALQLVESPYLCFLDDDNLWRHDHLSSLFRSLAAGDFAAAHSWRQLIDKDGRPWRPDRFPWLPPGHEERHLFDLYRRHGVLDADRPVVRDRVSLPVDDRDYGMVDLGEWLFRTELWDFLCFETSYSEQDLEERRGEDDKVLARIRALRLPTVCTEKATLIYRLGGLSTRPHPSGGVRW